MTLDRTARFVRGAAKQRYVYILVFCLGAVLALASPAFSNATPPPTKESPVPVELGVDGRSEPAKFVIYKEPSARWSRIIIPAKFIVPLQANEPAKPKVGSIDATRSIVAGLAMSLAIAACWIIARRRSRTVRAVVTACALLIGGAMMPALASFAVEPEASAAKIVVEVVAEGEQVILIQGSDFARQR